MRGNVRLGSSVLAVAVLFMAARIATGAAISTNFPADFPGVFAPARATTDGASWVALPPPSARYTQSAILDSKRDRMIVFGGTSETDAWALSLAGAGSWTVIHGAGTPPPARTMQTAIYDRPRDRMIMFGGYVNGVFLNDVWALSLSGTPTWSQVLPEGYGPGPLASSSAIYDPIRDRMVVFGGMTALGPSPSVWELSLSGTPTWAWVQLSDLPFPGLARYAHAAVYDALRDRMLVFGGVQQGLRLSDVWACDFSGTNGWYELSSTGATPTPRLGPVAVYASAGDRLVIYGGYDGTGRGDARALSLGAEHVWTDVSPEGTAPNGRWWHSAVYDSTRDRLVTFGGRDSLPHNDAWALSLAPTPAWTQLAAVMPPPRQMHSAILDEGSNSLVIFGGYNGFTEPFYQNDVWKLTLSTPPAWHEVAPAGTPPAPRCSHSAIYDPLRHRMIVFGGKGSGGFMVDDSLWALSLTGTPTWTQLAAAGTPPSGTYGHSAIYDPVRDRMLLFSGSGSLVWTLDLSGETPVWGEVRPDYTFFYGFIYETGIYDPVRDRFVIFGGYSDFYSTNYALALNLAGTPTWSGGGGGVTAPPRRVQSGAVYDPAGDRMVIFGGASNLSNSYYTNYYNDTWALALGTDTIDTLWTPLAPSGGAPAGRTGHTASFDAQRDRMIVFGGWDGTSVRNDAYALYLSSTVSVPDAKPAALRLAAPYPNPARGATSVEFELPVPARVALEVFDLHGRRLARLTDGVLPAGRHVRTWGGRDASNRPAGAGVFFVRLTANGASTTRRLVRLGDQP